MCEKISIPAKINLSLEVTGRRGNLHTLDMQAVSVNIFDTVEYRKTENDGVVFEIICSLDGFDEKRFRPLIESAIEKFEARYGEVNAFLRLTKNIPLGAGMGGSTASTVAVLKTLAKIKNVPLDDEFLLQIGSDAPYMAKGGYARISGVGEIVENLGEIFLNFVVVKPDGGVDSGDAYALFDRYGSGIYGERRNDLERASRMLNSGVATGRRILQNLGANDVVLTGSGSAVVGVFSNFDEAKAVFDKLPHGVKGYLLTSISSCEI